MSHSIPWFEKMSSSDSQNCCTAKAVTGGAHKQVMEETHRENGEETGPSGLGAAFAMNRQMLSYSDVPLRFMCVLFKEADRFFHTRPSTKS